MRSLRTWKMILTCLENRIPVMLLYVLESKGSSPGRQGFCMAVDATGRMEGSIGGGMMEFKWVEVAKERLKESNTVTHVRRQVHDKSAASDQSGMICSGEQTILLYLVKQEDKKAVMDLVNSLERHMPGTLTLTAKRISFSGHPLTRDAVLEKMDSLDWTFQIPTGYVNHLTIVGGGHCSLALSKLMRDLDFYIRVFDDRQHLNTLQANSFAHEVTVLDHYSELGKMLPVTDEHYLVIMTFGYRTDDQVIRAVRGRQFKYLGLLGSANKINTMMSAYREEKFPEEWLQSIHAPIGVDIHSRTPEEIAVSIAAQIIRIKNSA